MVDSKGTILGTIVLDLKHVSNARYKAVAEHHRHKEFLTRGSIDNMFFKDISSRVYNKFSCWKFVPFHNLKWLGSYAYLLGDPFDLPTFSMFNVSDWFEL